MVTGLVAQMAYRLVFYKISSKCSLKIFILFIDSIINIEINVGIAKMQMVFIHFIVKYSFQTMCNCLIWYEYDSWHVNVFAISLQNTQQSKERETVAIFGQQKFSSQIKH